MCIISPKLTYRQYNDKSKKTKNNKCCNVAYSHEKKNNLNDFLSLNLNPNDLYLLKALIF